MASDEKPNETSLIGPLSGSGQVSTRASLVKRGLRDISEDQSATRLPSVPGDLPQLLQPEEPWPNEEPNHLHGGPRDWGDAQRLAAQGNWHKALELMEKILDLPPGAQASEKRLLAIMQDKSQVRMEYKSLGKDTSGQYQAKTRARLGGGCAPAVMAFRAQCITGVIIDMITASRDAGHAQLNDAGFSKLSNAAHAHVVLIRNLFYSDPENLVRAASLCYARGQLKPSQEARQLVQRAVDIAPENELAKGLLKLMEKRIAEATAD